MQLHRYLYGVNDPVNQIDPLGKQPFYIGELPVIVAIQGILREMEVVKRATSLVLFRERARILMTGYTITMAFLAPERTNLGVVIDAKLFRVSGGKIPDLSIEYRVRPGDVSKGEPDIVQSLVFGVNEVGGRGIGRCELNITVPASSSCSIGISIPLVKTSIIDPIGLDLEFLGGIPVAGSLSVAIQFVVKADILGVPVRFRTRAFLMPSDLENWISAFEAK
jgi:hypothetical protein